MIAEAVFRRPGRDDGVMEEQMVMTDDLDGRRLRRERNREAVVDALLELYREGNFSPSSAQISERAGSSPRSLFRYFDDVDDLCGEAIRRQEELSRPMIAIGVTTAAPFGDRVAALIASRVSLFETTGPVGQVARMRAPFQPLIAAELSQGRTFLRNQIKRLFAAELAALDPARATAALAGVDVLCSYESYQLLRGDQGHGREQAVELLVVAVSALFGGDRAG